MWIFDDLRRWWNFSSHILLASLPYSVSKIIVYAGWKQNLRKKLKNVKLWGWVNIKVILTGITVYACVPYRKSLPSACSLCGLRSCVSESCVWKPKKYNSVIFHGFLLCFFLLVLATRSSCPIFVFLLTFFLFCVSESWAFNLDSL